MSKRKPLLLAIDFPPKARPVVGRTDERGAGLATQISWWLLVEDLRKAGKIRDEETVKRFEIDEDGITIILTTTAQA